jgi:hypothetical protein
MVVVEGDERPLKRTWNAANLGEPSRVGVTAAGKRLATIERPTCHFLSSKSNSRKGNRVSSPDHSLRGIRWSRKLLYLME